MKALIIGAAGFVGGYLINELRSAGWEVCATCLANEKIDEECINGRFANDRAKHTAKMFRRELQYFCKVRKT